MIEPATSAPTIDGVKLKALRLVAGERRA